MRDDMRCGILFFFFSCVFEVVLQPVQGTCTYGRAWFLSIGRYLSVLRKVCKGSSGSPDSGRHMTLMYVLFAYMTGTGLASYVLLQTYRGNGSFQRCWDGSFFTVKGKNWAQGDPLAGIGGHKAV
jgi:hypothetical protein